MCNFLGKFKIFFLILLVIICTGKALEASTLSDDELLCYSDIALDFDSGNILYGKNQNEKIYPASTTKILTAILTIENLDLNQEVTVSNTVINSIPYGSSVMGVKKGEVFTIEQLLYGLLLPSGNDAALVLAEAVSGNINDFVILMNKKLKELNLNDTHFVNPHGFHDNNHYSTAKDMAYLLKYCLNNDTFKKIFCTLEYTIPPTNLTSKEKTLRNTTRMMDPLYKSMYYEYMKGGKTGYTIEANGTFVGLASKDEKNVIVCSFNGSQNVNGYQARFLDAQKLAEFVFDNFSYKLILKAGNYKYKVYDSRSSKYYTIGLTEDISGLVQSNAQLTSNIIIDPNYDNLSLLDSVEETSTNNSSLGNIILRNNNFTINSIELKYLGSNEYIQLNTSSIYIVFSFILIVFLFILLTIYYTRRIN